MNTFFNILQTLTNKKNKTYPDDPFMLHTSSNFNDYTNETYHIDFLIKRIFYEEKKQSTLRSPYHVLCYTYRNHNL